MVDHHFNLNLSGVEMLNGVLKPGVQSAQAIFVVNCKNQIGLCFVVTPHYCTSASYYPATCQQFGGAQLIDTALDFPHLLASSYSFPSPSLSAERSIPGRCHKSTRTRVAMTSTARRRRGPKLMVQLPRRARLDLK